MRKKCELIMLLIKGCLRKAKKTLTKLRQFCATTTTAATTTTTTSSARVKVKCISATKTKPFIAVLLIMLMVSNMLLSNF